MGHFLYAVIQKAQSLFLRLFLMAGVLIPAGSCRHASVVHVPFIYNHPGWIHRLPEEGVRSRVELSSLGGVWIRNVRNEYSIASPIAVSRGRARIWVGVERVDAYVKIEDRIQVLNGESGYVSYREEGNLVSAGPWILFEPKGAWWAESEPTPVIVPPGGIQEKDLIFPVVARKDYREVDFFDEPSSLLFYLDDRRGELVPLAYESLGRVYSYGLFEFMVEPYDRKSGIFFSGLRKVTEQEFDFHGYRPGPTGQEGERLWIH